MASEKKDNIRIAFEQLAEAAESLAVHGAGGYTVETSALDEVFRRSLVNLNRALDENDSLLYDPYLRIFESLPDYI